MKYVVQTQDLILSQSINALAVIKGVPFKGYDREILEYLYSKHNEPEVTIDDAPILEYILHEMRHEYLMENGHIYCHIGIDEPSGELAVLRGEDNTFVEFANECPTEEDAQKAWNGFIERNDGRIFK